MAVLVAEDLSGRYQTVIETLSQFLPFIGIEIKVLKLPAHVRQFSNKVAYLGDAFVSVGG